jgi:hypothetical protein
MIIGSDRKLCNISSMSVSVNRLDNTEVSEASNFKYLGVTITANFTWSEHIDQRQSTPPINARILFYLSYSQSLTMRMLYGETKIIQC